MTRTPRDSFNNNAADHGDRPALPCPDAPALLLIDIQKKYCDPAGHRGTAETAAVARKIASIVPAFRAAGLPLYPVYAHRSYDAPDIDFYEFIPAPHDTVIRKDADSAFKGSKINTILRRDGCRTLLVCGFNLNACVFDTVCDALDAGYAVWLLRDLTGNDRRNPQEREAHYLERMTKMGVHVTDAATALAHLPRGSAPRRRHLLTPDD